jgi:hypothetical protein
MRLFKTIAWALTGLALSTSLAACAGRPKAPPETTVIYKPMVDAPAADLLVCATRPEGFSPEAWSVIPASVREKIIEIMKAFKANADRQDRLINRYVPGSCTVQ